MQNLSVDSYRLPLMRLNPRCRATAKRQQWKISIHPSTEAKAKKKKGIKGKLPGIQLQVIVYIVLC